MNNNVINLAEWRKRNNKTVLEKMKNGDNLSINKTEDTWFPPKGTFDRSKGRMVPEKETPPAPTPAIRQPTELELILGKIHHVLSVPEVMQASNDQLIGIPKGDLIVLFNETIRLIQKDR
jgi:hypothetical protein